MTTQTIKIKAYQYEDLSEDSQWEVTHWVDEAPWVDDDDDEYGSVEFSFFSDLNESEKAEHCNANEYLFDKEGKPIHHLIISEEK